MPFFSTVFPSTFGSATAGVSGNVFSSFIFPSSKMFLKNLQDLRKRFNPFFKQNYISFKIKMVISVAVLPYGADLVVAVLSVPVLPVLISLFYSCTSMTDLLYETVNKKN